MKEIKGNLWDFHDKGEWIVITTNGTIKNNGDAVMGRGVANQAAKRYPSLPTLLGDRLRNQGNQLFVFDKHKIITLPVKHHWHEIASLLLIKESIRQLATLDIKLIGIEKVYLPRPGCGNGQLKWEDVKPIVSTLDDRFTVVEFAL